jgi:bifunctional DNase/RNase
MPSSPIEPPSGTTPKDPEGWVEMRMRGLILDPNSGAPVVILREEGSAVYLPIWIGVFEANAIALAAEGVVAPRPLTHDLLRGVLEGLRAQLLRIEIHSLVEGTFHARLVVRSAEGLDQEIDARPSDTMVLALRTGAPIWAARQVLDQAIQTSRAYEAQNEERLREWLERARPEDFGKYEM